jgi:hypothetical protein
MAVGEWLLREATEADAATLVALIHGAFAVYQGGRGRNGEMVGKR